MNELLWFLIFFTPAYVGNMAPPFFRKLRWDTPLDFGRTFRGHPVFGKNKTWRGLVAGMVFGGLTGILLQALGLPFAWWWGLVLGFSALLGDALKSFAKRQLGIRPGASWFPFDQLDFVVVAYLASLAFTRFTPWTTFAGFAVIFVGTVIVQYVGGKTGVKADRL